MQLPAPSQVVVYMIRSLLLVACIATLAACNKPDAAVDGDKAAGDRRTAKATSVKPGAQLSEPLPVSVSIDFPHRVQYDRIERRGDASERVVAVEVTDGTQESIADNVNASMLDAGFKLGKRHVMDNGHVRMTYRMKRYGTAFVTVEAGSGRESGRVVYRWVPSGES